jgi:hypothetical protein
MYRRLLVTYQNMVNAAYRMQRIINIEDCASRVAEHLLHALIDKRSDDHFRARQHLHALPPGFCYRRQQNSFPRRLTIGLNRSYILQSDSYLNRSL